MFNTTNHNENNDQQQEGKDKPTIWYNKQQENKQSLQMPDTTNNAGILQEEKQEKDVKEPILPDPQFPEQHVLRLL